VHARLAAIAVVLASTPALAKEAEPRVWLLDFTVTTEIGLDRGDAGDPVSVAPDLSLITRGFPRIEIVHSSAAITGFHGLLPGTSLCVYGDVCDVYESSVYHNGGLQLSYTLRSHAVDDDPSAGLNRAAFSVTAGVIANNIDPFTLAAKLGVRGSFLTSSFLQIQMLPSVHLVMTSQGERPPHRLFAPVTFTVVPAEKMTLQLETGIAAPFDDFEQNLVIPVGLNLDVTTGNGVDFVASFTLPAAHGGDAVGLTGLDARVVTVGLRWSKYLGARNE
jgi:hypothetical protein